MGDRARRARPHFRAARRVSRPGERGRRGGADVRHARRLQAEDADLSAGSPARQDQTEVAPMANDVAVATLPLQKTVRTGNGRTISYREAGAGTPLMLLHGIGSGSASFETQFGLPGYRIIAWDAPGYGQSDPLPDAKPKTKDYADSLAAFLDTLGIKQAHIVGHSLGGLMAGSFARH